MFILPISETGRDGEIVRLGRAPRRQGNMQRPPCASLSLGYLSTRAMQLKPGKHMRYAHTVSLITKIGTSKQLSKLKITTFF